MYRVARTSHRDAHGERELAVRFCGNSGQSRSDDVRKSTSSSLTRPLFLEREVRARSVPQDLENVRQVMLELVKLGECFCEVVLQVEVCLQLTRNVESRRVLEVCKLLPELCLFHLQVVQQPFDFVGIRKLASLHVADKPPQPIEGPFERRFDISGLEYAQCDL